MKKLRDMLCLILLVSGVSLNAVSATTSTESKVIKLDFSDTSGMTITGGVQGGPIKGEAITEANKITIIKDCITIVSNIGYKDNEESYIHLYGNAVTKIQCTAGNISKIKFTFKSDNKGVITSSDGKYKSSSSVWTTDKEQSTATFTCDSKQNLVTAIEVTYTPTSSNPPTLADPQIAFTKTAYTLKYGEKLSLSATSAAGSTGDVTYDLSNLQDNQLATAEVNQTDNQVDITAGNVREGSFTVTANIAATDTYKAASTTCTVSITKTEEPGPDTPTTDDDDSHASCSLFQLATNTNEFQAGDQLIFVLDPEDKNKGVAMSNQKEDFRDVTLIQFNPLHNAFTSTDACQILTLEGTPGNWYFNTGDGYLSARSDNKIGIETKLSKDDNAKAQMSLAKGQATIKFGGTNKNNNLRCSFNARDNVGSFKCYAPNSPTGKSFSIYKGVKEAVSTNDLGMSTLWTTRPMDFTHIKGIKAYIATVVGNQIHFTRIKRVPANTGVLLISSTKGKSSSSIPVLESVTELVASEFVAGTGSEVSSYEGEYTNYILNNGANGLGFYLANNQKVAVGKAYLRTKVSQSATFISIPVEITTDITDTTISTHSTNTTSYYTLGGIRTAVPSKGKLYIHDHKKIHE